MITPKQYQDIKATIDTFQSKIARLQGQQEEIKRSLAAEFEVSTIEEAKELRDQLQAKYEKAQQKFQSSYEQFHDQYANLL